MGGFIGGEIMANNETLGASFSIDVTNLKAGLAQANRLIKESQSEFQAAAAGMDDWTESEEGLTAKIQSLNSITDIQRKKVDALQAEYDRLVADGLDPASKQAVELRTQINKETAALNKNEAELKQQTQALSDLEDGTRDAGDATDEMGDKFGGLKSAGGIAAGAIAAVGAACVAAVGAFFGLAESTREYRNEMAQLAQNAKDSGTDLDTVKNKLAEVSAVTGEADAAMEGMNMLMATGLDTSQIEAASDALAGAATRFDGLKFEGMAEGLQETLATGVAVGPFAELIERTGGDLEAFNAGLANCTTEAEQQAYAMQFLTQSGLIEANAEYKKMNEDLYNAEMAQHNLNDALAELGAIAEPIMTTIKTLAADLLTTITPFVQLMGEGLAGALNGTAGAADSLAQGLSGIITTALNKIIEMIPFVIETVVAIIPTLINAILEKLPTILQLIINVVIQVINALTAMLPQIITAIMNIIPQLINALIAAIPQLLQAAIQLLMAIVNALPTIITNLIAALPSVIQTVINALITAIPMLIQAAIQLFNAIVQAIPTIIQSLTENLPSIIETIIDGVVDAIPLLLDGAIQLLMAIVQAIPTIIDALIVQLPHIIRTITGTLLANLPLLINAAIKLFFGILEAIPKIQIELIKQMPQIIASIAKGLTSGISDIVEIGGDIIRGLWEGISDMGDWIAKKIKGFGEDVLGGIKDFFGIHSPSDVMADQVGKNLALGIGEGFEKNIAGVNREITDAMNFDDPNININATRGGVKGGVLNVYQTNNYKQAYESPLEKYKSKQQLYAAARMIKAGAF